MAYRILNDIKYPVPGMSTAIEVLRPGAKWDICNKEFVAWECPNNSKPPTWEELQEEIQKEVEIYNYYLYERNREKEYPELKDQLDMLYHDIKNGNLENGSWINAIDNVKSNHPKPD